MATTLFENESHRCLMFTDLVDEEDGQVVQANQFLIIDHGHGALVDPGGQIAYNELYLATCRYFAPKHLDWVLASHADPDIIASVGRWLTTSSCRLAISGIWARFIPHFCPPGKTRDRIVAIPDEGMRLVLGQSHLIAIPAHFMHAEGNFQFYDPVSRILFSGDLGASMVPAELAAKPVEDFAAHVPSMEAFHRRYIVSNKVTRLWAQMVRGLDIEAIVPQHGRPFMGRTMAMQFVDWIENLACGIDLFGPQHYMVPA